MKKLIFSVSARIISIMFCLAMPGFIAVTPALAQVAPTIAGCAAFPEDNIWNTPIDNLPLDHNMSAGITTGAKPSTL